MKNYSNQNMCDGKIRIFTPEKQAVLYSEIKWLYQVMGKEFCAREKAVLSLDNKVGA